MKSISSFSCNSSVSGYITVTSPNIYGCTDPTATNYNANANQEFDPSNCFYLIYGCTNPTAFNYNPDANINDGSCVFIVCTDPLADNYNSDANVDDDSCEYSFDDPANLFFSE